MESLSPIISTSAFVHAPFEAMRIFLLLTLSKYTTVEYAKLPDLFIRISSPDKPAPRRLGHDCFVNLTIA
ncbi:MAG: hypothetical protein MO853_13140 [Candidatus Protistobacter heckmanni]|nr:hypothetical protein [Candidatus Protistobacter heckmanni]